MRIEKRKAELTSRVREGDRAAFADFYELYLEELYRYVFYRLKHKEDAEELTEQVFLKAWASLPMPVLNLAICPGLPLVPSG